MEPDKNVKKDCPHMTEMKIKTSKQKKCEACAEKEHLRICTSCGKVFCCESFNAHNTKHYKASGHPIIKPIHCNYDFTWCYKCESYIKEKK